MDELLLTYIKNRTQGETKHNISSSRSHAVFRMVNNGIAIAVVDLAGSERTNKEVNGKNEETSIINKSLLTLGKCLQALREKANNQSIMIPYRESKLTKVLAEFLCDRHLDFVMVANISLSANMVHENLKVLEYASITN